MTLPRPNKAKAKIMFIDIRGFVHSDFCHWASRSISKSTRKSCRVYFTQWAWRGEVVAGQIVAASLRQCTCLQRTEHQTDPGREEYRRTGTSFEITWFCYLWLFSFPQAQGDHQWSLFWTNGDHLNNHNNRAERHTRSILLTVT